MLKNRIPVVVAGVLFFVFISIASPVNAAKVDCSVGVFSFTYVPQKDRNILKKVNSIKCYIDESMANAGQAGIDQCLKQAGYSQQSGVYVKDLECSGKQSEKNNAPKTPPATTKPVIQTTPDMSTSAQNKVVDEAKNEIIKVIAPIMGEVKNVAEKAKDVSGNFKDRLKVIKENTADKLSWREDLDELTEEDFEITKLKPNTYEIIKVDDSPNVTKFVDIYGKEQYTTDGKYYYDSYGKAVKPGINGLVNKTKGLVGSVRDFLFKTKYKDTDKQLRNDVAREVLRDLTSTKEADLNKLHKEYASAIGNAPGLLGKYASVPADAIIKLSNEASETDFAQGAEYYFQERESGRSFENIYNTPPEEIEYGVGALTHSKYPKAVLYTKYEEVYQKYKLAKQLGRE